MPKHAADVVEPGRFDTRNELPVPKHGPLRVAGAKGRKGTYGPPAPTGAADAVASARGGPVHWVVAPMGTPT